MTGGEMERALNRFAEVRSRVFSAQGLSDLRRLAADDGAWADAMANPENLGTQLGVDAEDRIEIGLTQIPEPDPKVPPFPVPDVVPEKGPTKIVLERQCVKACTRGIWLALFAFDENGNLIVHERTFVCLQEKWICELRLTEESIAWSR